MMEDDIFDLRRLRKNWLEKPRDKSDVGHGKFESVAPSIDPLLEGMRLLEKIQDECSVRFPAESDTLTLSIDEMRRLLKKAFVSEEAEEEEQEQEEEEEQEQEQEEPLEELTQQLMQLEDFIEAIVFTL